MAEFQPQPADPPVRVLPGGAISSTLDDIDLIDRMTMALEQARAVSLAICDQLDAAAIPRRLLDQLAAEIGVVHTRIVEAQFLLDDLASRRS